MIQAWATQLVVSTVKLQLTGLVLDNLQSVLQTDQQLFLHQLQPLLHPNLPQHQAMAIQESSICNLCINQETQLSTQTMCLSPLKQILHLHLPTQQKCKAFWNLISQEDKKLQSIAHKEPVLTWILSIAWWSSLQECQTSPSTWTSVTTTMPRLDLYQ